jgi:hypothetical protein
MKRGLKLRRFKSEVSVHEEKCGVTNGKPSAATTLSIEPSGGGESDATELLEMESLSHAVSQPNILHIKQPSPHLKHKRPTGKAFYSVSPAYGRPEFATVHCVTILPISIILQSNLPFII